jgi:hypothetical protein
MAALGSVPSSETVATTPSGTTTGPRPLGNSGTGTVPNTVSGGSAC